MNRIEKVLNNLPTGFEAGLVNSDVNRFYLLGMQSSAGTIVLFPEKAYFIIDFRYIELAQEKVKNAEVMLQENLHAQIAALMKKHNATTLSVEQTMSVGELNKLQVDLPEIQFDKSDSLTMAIEKARAIKELDEIQRIKEAQRITDETFSYICTLIEVGKKEKDLALEMEIFMKKNGAEGLAFSTIFVSGTNSSLPHGVPSDKLIQKGDFITMDFGARYGGYNTDMTRTVAVGSVTDEMRTVYNIVLDAQLKALDAIRAGANCKSIDAIARDLIYGAGYEGKFGHGLGHAVGIEIHESPRFSPSVSDDVVLEAGMMMTVEPGIYLPGKFGVRIEDSVIVTETGYDNLANSPKELIIL